MFVIFYLLIYSPNYKLAYRRQVYLSSIARRDSNERKNLIRVGKQHAKSRSQTHEQVELGGILVEQNVLAPLDALEVRRSDGHGEKWQRVRQQ